MDTFDAIATYYDIIMEHVNYDRWFTVATALAELLPPEFQHVDAACGTGTLIKRLRRLGWRTYGIDLSPSMLKAGRRDGAKPAVVTADLCALPFHRNVDYVTCLFDSINFLLERESVAAAFRAAADALTPDGLYYFDAVTEKMVTQHFDGQQWTESNRRFSTTWRSDYDRKTGVVETTVRVNTGAAGTVHERVYSQDEIEEALEQAGFTLLGVVDAHSWQSIRRKTIRMDFVVAKDSSKVLKKRFNALKSGIRASIV